jgi:hypothetical protein
MADRAVQAGQADLEAAPAGVDLQPRRGHRTRWLARFRPVITAQKPGQLQVSLAAPANAMD